MAGFCCQGPTTGGSSDRLLSGAGRGGRDTCELLSQACGRLCQTWPGTREGGTQPDHLSSLRDHRNPSRRAASVPFRTTSAFRGPLAAVARSLGSHCQGHATVRPPMPFRERPGLRKASSAGGTETRHPNPAGGSPRAAWQPWPGSALGNHRWRAAKGRAAFRPHLP